MAADGSVDSLGSLPVDAASPADGVLPVYAAIASAGDDLYVAVATAVQAGQPFPASLARVRDGVTHPLPDPPGYGPITFTDAGALVITVPSDGRVAGPAENRWISTDQGATWRSISIPPGTFPVVRILLGISEQAAVAYDGADPNMIGLVDDHGAVTGAADFDEESVGWLAVAPEGSATATLVGMASGSGELVDRSSGAPVAADPPPLPRRPRDPDERLAGE